ncbi:MAG TPA: site-specific integrase [Candidatus Angelobacter sp.]
MWEFLWRESGTDGKRHQRTLVIGTLAEFPTKSEARKHVLKQNANINQGRKNPAVFKFDDLADHYAKHELVESNESLTPKSRETNRGYIDNWMRPKWGNEYVHSFEAIAWEEWLKTLDLAAASKAKIRNIGSVMFNHGVRHKLLGMNREENPFLSVRQSSKRERIPEILEVAELHRLFDVLAVREKAMIVADALTGIRRGELMGLWWEDIDFIGGKINIIRSVVDQDIGKCKTEASRKPVPMNEHIAQVLTAWRRESAYTAAADWVWASPMMEGKQPLWLSTIMRYYIQPAAKDVGIKRQIGWHTFRHTFSSLVKSLGTDAKVVQELLRHASFKTTMDSYTQAMDEPKRLAQNAVTELIMREQKVGRA